MKINSPKATASSISVRIVVMCLLGLSVHVTAWAEPQLELKLAASKIENGEPFVVDILQKGMPLTHSGRISIQYDARFMHALGVVFSGAWNMATNAGIIDNDKGTLTDIQFAASSGNEGSTPIATLWFVAKKPGKSSMTVERIDKDAFIGAGGSIPIRLAKRTIEIVPAAHTHKH